MAEKNEEVNAIYVDTEQLVERISNFRETA